MAAHPNLLSSIRYGLDLGVNFYDTAIAYQNGTSEQHVGRALKDFAKRKM